MLVDGDRKTLLRFVLSDDVFVEKDLDVLRLWKCRAGSSRFRLFVVIDDLVTDINALVANIDAGAGDQLFDVVLRLTAKRAAEEFFGSAELSHREVASCQSSIR